MIKRLREAYIPLFTQITVPYILLALLIAAGGTYVVTRLIFQSLEERFLNELIQTTIISKQSLVRTEESLLAAQRLAGHTIGVAQAISAGDTELLRALVEPGAFNTGLEALAILQADGQALLSLGLDDASNGYQELSTLSAYSQQDFVHKALTGAEDTAGDKFVGLVPTQAGQYLFVSGPVYSANGELVGAALAGVSLNTLSVQVRAETLAQVSFYDNSGFPLSSSFEEAMPLDAFQLSDLRAHPEDGVSRNLGSAQSGQNELISAWQVRDTQALGYLGIALAPRFLVQASQFTRENTLVLMVASLLLVILIGLLIANYISRPIQELKLAAQQIAAGNLQVSVPEQGQNEISVLSQSFNAMAKSLRGSRRQLFKAYDETIEGWAQATDLRDHETEGHSRRVADLSVQLAKSLGLHGADLVHLYRGALLHDIGKIGIRDEILLKPGKLDAEELLQMQKHPVLAKDFLEKIEFLQPAMDVPYAHHERWDGSGYPRGLKGTDIPLSARIFAVVDVWDALTSDRPYRRAWSRAETLAHIKEQSGKHFDPAMAQAFLEMMQAGSGK
ncbi:MAG: HD domain-containing protein [Anaerolineales bacterium]|nr:HD domain-containing protein [Anaerolineales bacterium]